MGSRRILLGWQVASLRLSTGLASSRVFRRFITATAAGARDRMAPAAFGVVISLVFGANAFAVGGGCDGFDFINVVASTPALYEKGGATAQFVFTDSVLDAAGDQATLQISGTATNGVDYQPLPTTATIFFGSQAVLTLTPKPDAISEGIETVTVTIIGTNRPCLVPGTPSSATISIVDGTPAIQLAITSVNGGIHPTAGVGFDVAVQAQDATGAAQKVLTDTSVTLSKHTGTGVLGGSMTCTINALADNCIASGVTYSVGEAGVSLTAARTSGDALSAANSAPFTVDSPPIYTVTYDGNLNTGGSVPLDGNLYATGAKVIVLGNTGGLVRTGLTFGNWNTASDGSGASYAGGASFLMGAANVTLSAHWSVAGSTPLLVGTSSRKVHGAAGTFDLPLSFGDIHSPTTEPRQGPSHTIVFTFDKPLTAGNAAVTEGVATASAPTFSGNEMRVPLSGVINQQYVTVGVNSVTAADGGTGGSASVRIGFLLGDVSQNRVVTLSDLAQINAQVAQPVTVANHLKDVNVTGTITVADKGITNQQVTKALPAP